MSPILGVGFISIMCPLGCGMVPQFFPLCNGFPFICVTISGDYVKPNTFYNCNIIRSITLFCGTNNISRNIRVCFSHSFWMWEISGNSVDYCQSHKTLLWIWIMSWYHGLCFCPNKTHIFCCVLWNQVLGDNIALCLLETPFTGSAHVVYSRVLNMQLSN